MEGRGRGGMLKMMGGGGVVGLRRWEGRVR